MDGQIVDRKPGWRCVRNGDLGIWERDPDGKAVGASVKERGSWPRYTLTPASMIPIDPRPEGVVAAAVEIVEQYARQIGIDDLDELTS